MFDQSPDPDTLAFQELYRSILFLLALFLAGDVFCRRFLRIIPSLVGQIFVGVIFGPYVLDWVSPYFSTLGQIGLLLMICQAGLEMDFATLQAIGPRGTVMAVVGSVLPSGIGIFLCYTALGLSPSAAIAAGCSFGPTSAGIAMNVLEQCGVLGSQVGQLVVAIAIVDDILALVVLSQLRALTGAVTVSSILIPIISAFLWLFAGGAAAIFIMPHVLERLERLESMVALKYSKRGKPGEQSIDTRHDHACSNSPEGGNNAEQITQGAIGDAPLRYSHLWHILILLLALLPATFYTEASYLLGAFLAGLAACRCHPQVTADYQEQFTVPIAWLMRIFFGATIGFEIPVTLFFEDPGAVMGPGFLLALSLLGKVATGPLLTPILTDTNDSSEDNTRRRFDRQHLRDVAIVGFSMAGEAEFAFLVAGFGRTEGLYDEKTYASVVFAILLSTVISPIMLRSALSFFGPPKSAANDDCIVIKKNEYTSEDNESSNNVDDYKQAADEA